MLQIINPVTLRKAKIVYNFGLSECNRVKRRVINVEFPFFQTLTNVEREHTTAHPSLNALTHLAHLFAYVKKGTDSLTINVKV